MPEFDYDGALAEPAKPVTPPRRVELNGPQSIWVLDEPLTEEATLAMFQELGHVKGIVAVDLGDVINYGLEGFIDGISAKLSETLLGSIDYAVVGSLPFDTLFIEVSAGEVMGGVDFDGE